MTDHTHAHTLNWNDALERRSQRPLLAAEFVAALGRETRIIDVRERDELVGVAGHIPGSCAVALDDIGELPETLGRDRPVVLVSTTGERAGIAAAYLESLGMTHVAGLYGGIRSWRARGFAVSRDRAILERGLADAARVEDVPGGPIEPGAHLSLDQIRWHVGHPGAVRWVKYAALVLHGHAACIDGRDDSGIIGTPGGDAGEFVLGLAAVEKLSGRTLSDARIAALLEGWIDTFGRFYMHTDASALDKMIAALRADDRTAEAVADVHGAAQWRAFLRRPPEAVRPALLEHLVNPAHVGCGHLRLSMQHSADFEVRTQLITAFMRAFFEQRWAGASETEYVILDGDHGEGAVVQVTLDEALMPYTRVPLISPAFEGLQMFVIHPQVAGDLRRQRVQWLADELNAAEGTELEVEALGDEVTGLGSRQLTAVSSRLAKGLPVYEVRFGRDREFEVEAVE